MLRFFRDGLGKWAIYPLVALVCIIFALFGIESVFMNTGSHNEIAKVNKQSIDMNAFVLQLDKITQDNHAGIEQLYGDEPAAIANYRSAIKQPLLSRMISEALWSTQAEQLGLSISPNSARKQFLSTLNAQMGSEEFNKFMQVKSLSPEQANAIRNNVYDYKNVHGVRTLQSAIAGSVIVAQSELAAKAQDLFERHDYQILTIDCSKINFPAGNVDEDEIKSAYEQVKDTMLAPASATYFYVTLPKNGDSKVDNMTRDNLDMSINEQPKSLEKIATKLNADVQTSKQIKQGGDAPIFLPHSMKANIFDKGIVLLQRVTLFEDDNSFVLVQVKDYEPQKPMTLVAARDEIKSNLKKASRSKACLSYVEDTVNAINLKKKKPTDIEIKKNFKLSTLTSVTKHQVQVGKKASSHATTAIGIEGVGMARLAEQLESDKYDIVILNMRNKAKNYKSLDAREKENLRTYVYQRDFESISNELEASYLNSAKIKINESLLSRVQ